MSEPTSAQHTNRLIHESSPYLLQHAHNPVDWYAWGPEAFERAGRENKPIFLSVGYSTCYWCHVMERQSFENEAVAAEMNRLFVNIKVDREERPDVDQLYMTAVQVQTRQGGWPMSVFLTPDRRYFYGGTYFPPTDAYGRPGFVTLLRALADAYQSRRQDVEETAGQFLEILRRSAQPPAPRRAIRIDQVLIERIIEQSTSDYDPKFGGFGGAPKFPRQTLLELLLVYLDEENGPPDMPVSGLKAQFANLRSQTALKLRRTLDAMADGGIRDQLGGGFHRYSTDAQWLVPHFEIMLYDNAMLGRVYAEASRQFREPRYAQIARGIFEFVLREMTSPEGAFYTAFDAEVDAQEGLSYLWTPREIEQILGEEDAKLFNRVYGVDRGFNFADPHHGSGTPDKNILFLPQPLAAAAKEAGMDAALLESRLAPMRSKLYEARQRRKQPTLDTKIITSWNALMIRALAHAGKVISEPRYVTAASRAAEYLLKRHRREGGGLYRTSRDGIAKYDAFLDDYSFFIQSLLTLHDATGEDRWRQEAQQVAAAMRDRFGDAAGGFFYTDRGATDLEVRQKTATDSPLPSGNAVAAMVLTELGATDEARKTIGLFAEQMQEFGEGMSAMVQAAVVLVRREGRINVQPGTPQQEAVSSPRQQASAVVSWRTAWRSDRELLVTLDIQKGYHLNADASTNQSNDQVIPTRVSVEGESEVQIVYPAAAEQQFAFSDRPIKVFESSVDVIVRFPRNRRGGQPVHLTLSYQPCTDQACLAPVAQRLEVGS